MLRVYVQGEPSNVSDKERGGSFDVADDFERTLGL